MQKLLEDNVDNLDDAEFADDFLDTTPKAPVHERRINKLDFIKIKNFSSGKVTINRMKRQATA